MLNNFEKTHERIIEHKVSKALLKQTTVFFVTLGLLIGLWSAGFGLVLNSVGRAEENTTNKIQSISEKVNKNRIKMTELESNLNKFFENA